jgi:hypothetical protein
MRNLFFLVLVLSIFSSCKYSTTNKQEQQVADIVIPTFSSDSAYSFIATQVNFGPRVPNTNAHIACANYLSEKLRIYGAEVIEQKVVLTAFDGTKLNSINIIASYQPKLKTRIALFAHWDTRPWSDHDPDPQNHKTPVLGANDGASGVGVLLEIARQLGQTSPAVGVDIIFFDSEDYGAPEDVVGQHEDSWCLGSQYWSNNPHISNYQANYGILLDMVGAYGAKFYKEQFSMYYAAHIVDKVWTTASKLGFGQFFVNEQMGAITDDHYYVNKLAKIPTIDIIQYDKQTENGFGHYWHTTHDNMENIDKNTLFAVGTTVMNVVYSENE